MTMFIDLHSKNKETVHNILEQDRSAKNNWHSYSSLYWADACMSKTKILFLKISGYHT